MCVHKPNRLISSALVKTVQLSGISLEFDLPCASSLPLPVAMIGKRVLGCQWATVNNENKKRGKDLTRWSSLALQ